MKKFKRVLALLLVGVMALAMLTACGDSGSSGSASLEDQFSDKLAEGFNTALGISGGNVLKEIAKQRGLNKVTADGIITESETDDEVTALSDEWVFTLNENDVNVEAGTVTIAGVLAAKPAGVGKYKVATYPESELRRVIGMSMQDVVKELDLDLGELQGATILKCGVATKRLSDGTYTYAVAIEMKLA